MAAVLAVGLTALHRAHLEPCRAFVEHLRTRVVHGRFQSVFLVERTGRGSAWVYFEYSIRYRNTEGETYVERGVFREHLSTGQRVVTLEDLVLGGEPASSVTAIGEVQCSR